MAQHSRDDLWRDFSKTATEFEARFATEEDCRTYWIEALGRQANLRALQKRTRVDDPRGHDVRVRRLRPSDQPDLWHAAGEDAQALEDVVPRRVRDLDSAHGHLGQGPGAHHGLRLVQDGVDLTAQAAGGAGAPRSGAARPLYGVLEVKHLIHSTLHFLSLCGLGRDDDVEGSPRMAHEGSCCSLVFGGPEGPNHDAVLRIAAKLRGGGPILSFGIEAMGRAGPRHLEPSSATRRNGRSAPKP